MDFSLCATTYQPLVAITNIAEFEASDCHTENKFDSDREKDPALVEITVSGGMFNYAGS
jgi:hypothetical protein